MNSKSSLNFAVDCLVDSIPKFADRANICDNALGMAGTKVGGAGAVSSRTAFSPWKYIEVKLPSSVSKIISVILSKPSPSSSAS